MPRNFYDNHVRPNYDDWLANPLDERLAKNAVAEANNMAARVFRHWRCLDPAQLYGAAREGEYRKELAVRECPDFALLRDVAEAHKHVVLDRCPRQVTRSDQTEPEPHVYRGPSYYGSAVYGGSQLVVTLDDGTKYPLSEIMQNVMAMWERLLRAWSL